MMYTCSVNHGFLRLPTLFIAWKKAAWCSHCQNHGRGSTIQRTVAPAMADTALVVHCLSINTRAASMRTVVKAKGPIRFVRCPTANCPGWRTGQRRCWPERQNVICRGQHQYSICNDHIRPRTFRPMPFNAPTCASPMNEVL